MGKEYSLTQARNDSFCPARGNHTVRLSPSKRAYTRSPVAFQSPRREGMLLHLAGKETGVGRNKTWPTCSS